MGYEEQPDIPDFGDPTNEPPWMARARYLENFEHDSVQLAADNSVSQRKVGNMGMPWAKAFGVFFAAFTLWFAAYFVWSVWYDDTTVFQFIGRGTNVVILAYITYAIHSDIRSRVRYERDNGLYDSVEAYRKYEQNANGTTTRIDTLNVFNAENEGVDP